MKGVPIRLEVGPKDVEKEQVVIVDSSMIQEIEINEETHFLILENYVIGIVRE